MNIFLNSFERKNRRHERKNGYNTHSASKPPDVTASCKNTPDLDAGIREQSALLLTPQIKEKNMYLNGYSVRIPEGSEKEASGYVEMEHDTKYSLQLRNSKNTRCDAEVNIDGKHVGTFRLEAYGSMKLERSADDNRCFTFYLKDSEEGQEVELNSISKGELGLVQVIFRPEKRASTSMLRKTIVTYESSDTLGLDDDFIIGNPRGLTDSFGPAKTKGLTRGLDSISYCSAGPSYQAGGTGMSGHSNQTFQNVAALTYDDELTSTINIRLVGIQRKTRGPLKPVQKSTPIPPPVWTMLF